MHSRLRMIGNPTRHWYAACLTFILTCARACVSHMSNLRIRRHCPLCADTLCLNCHAGSMPNVSWVISTP
jgi:hypothetical protein